MTSNGTHQFRQISFQKTPFVNFIFNLQNILKVYIIILNHNLLRSYPKDSFLI